jgi:hypothetical protein
MGQRQCWLGRRVPCAKYFCRLQPDIFGKSRGRGDEIRGAAGCDWIHEAKRCDQRVHKAMLAGFTFPKTSSTVLLQQSFTSPSQFLITLSSTLFLDLSL